MNVTLKFKIYEKFRTQCDAASAFGMREDRLSQIVRGRRTPTDHEKRVMSRKLQSKIAILFPPQE